MSITLLLQYLGYFSSFAPILAVPIYWYKRGFSFDLRINLICVYILFYFVVQNIMLLLAMNGMNNLFIMRIYVPIEAFLFSYFLLSFQLKSKTLIFILSIVLGLAIIFIDLIWGTANPIPVESLMVEAIIITLIGMSAIPSIKIRRDYESSFFYFVFGILFASVNNLLGFGFIDLAPELSFNIQAVVTITSHLIFTWGFYVALRRDRTEITTL